METKTILRALQYVEWQNPESYETQKGKIKTIQRGLPTRPFWRAYKRHRATFWKLGVTVKLEGSHHTGDYKKGRPIIRKSWSVIAWRPETLNTITKSL